ncbi:M48 family metallopeptidase [Variovorax sp. NFACC27]|uniref:M48 family peptidase n=1 Tax=Variovorax gossypii TaxID=1679495 RepID=A0A3S0GTQ3_9BURK|nr:M48 family metallopeptidase [Variovorax gossypii]SEF25691.1 Zn-dependent protease with chaperone function [Variovorax sp. NFACC28]SEG44998.1 Zn-dependent protease with chaperone function [Variovorax sp. NFACC29]SFC28346.1 Zn-dependent protease with chaperone function [Variovorax sp. NFACC26]SFG61645.1 Zn-dependent protease with chaperone function [Variovorax sp. NFACC27]RTQ32520.1 M48 family peptidase [Variovorax gossypii]
MCTRCDRPVFALAAPSAASAWNPRRAFLLAAAGAVLAKPALAQVEVGKPSVARNIVPVEQIEAAGVQQYGQLLEQARAKGALAGESNPQLQRLRTIARRLVPFATPWNSRARDWKWEVNLIGSKQINAFCMPGGKIAFFTGILDQLKLTDDEVAMVMGHEMAHALREHARARMAKSAGTGAALSIGAQLLGWGQVGDLAARAGTQLITLKFSRSDESEADLVGLELAARAGYDPQASVSLWKKMATASKNQGGLSFLSTHPSGPDRIAKLESNLPKVEKLYREAKK